VPAIARNQNISYPRQTPFLLLLLLLLTRLQNKFSRHGTDLLGECFVAKVLDVCVRDSSALRAAMHPAASLAAAWRAAEAEEPGSFKSGPTPSRTFFHLHHGLNVGQNCTDEPKMHYRG
jgi:hypothetical protein